MSKIWDAIKRVERERTPGGETSSGQPGWHELVHAKESRLRNTGEPASDVQLSLDALRAELQPELEHQRQRAVNAESQLQYLEAVLRETKAQLEEQQASYAALQEASATTEQRLAAELHTRDEEIEQLQQGSVAGQRKERGKRTAQGGGKLAQVEFQLGAEKKRAHGAEARLQEVESILRQTQAELEEQRATCAHMEKGIEQSEKELVAEVMRRDREISRLKDLAADGDRLRSEAEEGRSQIATLQKALRKVRGELDAQLAVRADLDEKSRRAEETQAELRRLRTAAEEACASLESERAAAAEQQANSQRAVEELAGQAAAYQKEMVRLQAAVKGAQKEAQKRDRDMARRLAKAESLLATQEQRAAKAESELQKLGSAVQESQAALEAERASHAELQAAFRATQDEYRHVLESRERDNMRMQDLLRKVREDARESHDKFEARLANATAAQDAARAEAAETAAQLKDLRRALCAKQRDFDALRAARDKLEKGALATRQKLAEETKRRDAKILSIENALKEAQALAREERRGIQKEYEEAQQRARDEQSRAARAEGECDQLRTSLAALERDLDAARTRSSELQQALQKTEEKLTGDIEKREREIARYRVSSTAAQEQIERDRARIETRLAEAEAALADGRERLAEKTTEVKRLQARCKALEQHLAQPDFQSRVIEERAEQSAAIRSRGNARKNGAARVPPKDERAAQRQDGPPAAQASRAPSQQMPRRPTAVELRQPAPPPAAARPEKSRATVSAPFRIVAIGGSIGGPGTVAEIIGAMPGDVPACVLVVQHLPQGYTTEWAHSLNRQANIVVVEARNGDVLLPGRALIAPGGFHLKIEDGRVHLTDGPRVNSHRPSISVLFDSLLPVADRAHAVLLSGMGEDGVAAMEHLHAAGAETLVQDRASSVLWGMAGAAVEAGAVVAELAPKPLAQHLVRSVMERAGTAHRQL